MAIAYQVVGDGDTDLIYIPDYLSNLVYGWESSHWRGFYDRLAQSFRLILFDKRGTGLSDYGGHFPALETRMDDVRAVLDAVGSTSTVLLGAQDGCSMALLFAATYPERTRALEKDTAGDGFFATFDGPARAIRCAQSVVEGVRELGWTFARACTRGSARCTTPRSPASPSRSELVSPLRRAPGKCSSRRP